MCASHLTPILRRFLISFHSKCLLSTEDRNYFSCPRTWSLLRFQPLSSHILLHCLDVFSLMISFTSTYWMSSHSWSARKIHLVSLGIFKTFDLVRYEDLLSKYSPSGFHLAPIIYHFSSVRINRGCLSHLLWMLMSSSVPHLLPLFINERLGLNSKPIHCFADGAIIQHFLSCAPHTTSIHNGHTAPTCVPSRAEFCLLQYLSFLFHSCTPPLIQ